MYRIKQFFRRIYNLYRWFSIIWKDRDWDYWHTLEILKTKLKFQSEHFRKHGYHISSEREAEKMELCVRLIDKVQNEYYLDEALGLVTDEVMINAINKHDKAKRILFKLLEQNIEKWWN
jgi:hypothetical protein